MIYILNQLADLFNLSFSYGSFSTILKTSKVTPIYKKEHHLTLIKSLKGCIYCHLHKFFEDNKLIYTKIKQFITINGFNSDLEEINCGVP